LRIHPEKREKEEKKTESFLQWGEVKGRKGPFFLKRALNHIGSTKELQNTQKFVIRQVIFVIE